MDSMKILYALLILVSLFDIIIYTRIFSMHQKNLVPVTAAQQVLTTNITPTTFPTSTPALSPTASPTPEIVLKKSAYTIAAFGDSMVDTMGENLEYLQTALHQKYPKTTFHLYNYGIGGQNVTQGLERFDQAFFNRDRHFPPLSQLQSDVIIVGSFAYNPFAPHDRNRHYLELINLVEKAQAAGKKVYILSEIAPLQTGFGNGPNGVNWPEETSHTHALHILEQLEDARNVSQKLHVPLIDATTPSQTQGKFGNPSFVSTNDGIHPSVTGHAFTARIIAKTLNLQ